MKTLYFSIVSALLFAGSSQAHKVTAAPASSRVQLALLLDTSNSMDGLIGQAKTQLWTILNEISLARKNGVAPKIEIALYEYGNDRLDSKSHWIRQVQPFTDDLDLLSKDLFALKTKGGQEYCGAAIARSLKDLAWDDSNETYKAIFVAGNEPFTQGPISVVKICQKAASKGIIVNSIFCGDEPSGMASGWNTVMSVNKGIFMSINQDQQVAYVAAPQDAEILKLNTALNATYLGYGKNWGNSVLAQKRADSDAAGLKSTDAAVNRSISKSTTNYQNAKWDLVDACNQKGFDLAKVKREHLAKELQGKSEAELKILIAECSKKREEIKTKILELKVQREAFIAARAKAENPVGKERRLDQVMVTAIRAQLKSHGFDWSAVVDYR